LRYIVRRISLKKIRLLDILACALLFCGAAQAQAAKVAVETTARMLPCTTYLIATYDERGRSDAAVIDRAGIAETASGNNMIFYISVVPTRQTAKNIEASGAFTVNVMNAGIVGKGDYCGEVSAASDGGYFDKFAVTGLKIEKSETVNAPVLTECPVTLECRLLGTRDFDGGRHRMYLGEVLGYRLEATAPEGDKTKGAEQYDPVKSNAVVYFAGSAEHSGYYKLSAPYGRSGAMYRRKYPDGGGLEPKPSGK